MSEIMIVKEKLRQLRESADWDSSMLSLMTFWEKQIVWAEENDEAFYRLPKVVELAGMLEARLNYVNKEINNNRKLSNAERDMLFNMRDITEMELGIFRYGDFLDGIERQIDFESDGLRGRNIEENIDLQGTDVEDDLR